ncbi:GNAT family N-acetyltransferase, partial [Erysipelothrix rhusiopathiae]|nr:GNAT family N-acetyltransferase [Erysipelothrix rhusiopathiae]
SPVMLSVFVQIYLILETYGSAHISSGYCGSLESLDLMYLLENGNVSAETFYKKYGFVQKICIPDTLYGYPLKTLRMVYEVKR